MYCYSERKQNLPRYKQSTKTTTNAKKPSSLPYIHVCAIHLTLANRNGGKNPHFQWHKGLSTESWGLKAPIFITMHHLQILLRCISTKYLQIPKRRDNLPRVKYKQNSQNQFGVLITHCNYFFSRHYIKQPTSVP